MFKHNEQQPEGFQISLKEALDNLAFNDRSEEHTSELQSPA